MAPNLQVFILKEYAFKLVWKRGKAGFDLSPVI
jgi:hypothetical protein